jgi:hypothetical protein
MFWKPCVAQPCIRQVCAAVGPCTCRFNLPLFPLMSQKNLSSLLYVRVGLFLCSVTKPPITI